jgi:putative transposase
MRCEDDLFENRYRINSTRLEGWNYSWSGYYFVTVCTKKRICHFGDVIGEEMQLSEVGKIVEQEWLRTMKIRNNVYLDEFIVMPNHLHGIVIIKNDFLVETHCDYDVLKPHMVETHCNASLRKECLNNRNIHCDASLREEPDLFEDAYSRERNFKNKFGPQRNNLSSIIRGFKGSATKKIHKLGFLDFKWQSKFYDRVIRDEDELWRVREYIDNNPAQWEADRNNPINIKKK